MTIISYTLPTVGQPDSTEDPKIATALSTLLTEINGNLDAATNFTAAGAQAVGANQAGQTVKGATNIAASESRTNVAYGTLTTPDQVTGIVLPVNGLIAVWYQALWNESVLGAARAGLLLNSTLVQSQIGTGGGPAPTQASIGGSTVVGTNVPLTTYWGGIVSADGTTATPASTDVTTGQVVGGGHVSGTDVGGPCYIFAAAGTYTVSVQFKATSGSVTVANRKLWVQAISFA